MQSYSFDELVTLVAQQLANSATPKIRHAQEASWLIQHVVRQSSTDPYNSWEIGFLSGLQQELLQQLIKRRIKNHEPLAYILQTVPFCGLELQVEPPILIPRLETEEWCLELIDRLKLHKNSPLKIVDLCTGSGCLALSLAKAFPQSSVVGIDINPTAVELAKQNAADNALHNVTFMQADLFGQLPQINNINVFVANPPYISATQWQNLPPEVKDWEDPQALIAANAGLEFYPRIAFLAQQLLNPTQSPALCVVEIDQEQAEAVSNILQQHSLNPTIWQDSFGKNRAIFASK